jgi:4-amino-4-deoxy-L-arabinose transferase-like glycosyltransferase
MDWQIITMWLRIGTALIVFAVSCLSLAYFAERWALHRKWPGWTSILMSLGIALIWPAVVIIDTNHDIKQHHLQYPNEVDDASGFIFLGAIFVWAPFLFVLSFVLARLGAFIVRHKDSNEWHHPVYETPNKSLDRSGDSVFRIKLGPAKVE